MAGYKETPRQKMISMMYLVLYTLLALNVSKEVLDAFLVVNESVEQTNESLTDKIAGTVAEFKLQYDLNTAKVGPYWEKAKEVETKSSDFVKYLEHLKFKLVMVAEQKDSAFIINTYYYDSLVPDPFQGNKLVKKKFLNLRAVKNKDRYNDVTNYMLGNETKKDQIGEAYILSKKMHDFRKYILGIMNLDEKTTKVGLLTNEPWLHYANADGAEQDWETHNFYYTILAADITIINKIISETRIAEFDALQFLFRSVNKKDYKFDHVEAKVIPKSTYVLMGNKYEAEVLVAAYDTKTKPTVKVLKGTDKITDKNIKRARNIQGEGGVVKIEFPANSVGPQKYAGVIQMIDPATNQTVSYDFNAEYIVAPPSLTVAPLRMNVFYIGVENPVAITSPGLAENQIHPTISAGKLYKKDDHYAVMIKKKVPGNKVTISATANIDGKNIVLGSSEFRIKRVPDPIAEVAGQTNGKIDKNTLLAAGAIIPNMKDFLFDNYYFQITSYTFGTIENGDWKPKNVTGNRFTPEIIKIIRRSNRKQKIFFENIQAKGPDGSIRSLNPISLEIK